MGKITTNSLPHAGSPFISDVIVMLKLRHHVASQCIQDFLEIFFMFFQYKVRYLVGSKNKNRMG